MSHRTLYALIPLVALVQSPAAEAQSGNPLIFRYWETDAGTAFARLGLRLPGRWNTAFGSEFSSTVPGSSLRGPGTPAAAPWTRRRASPPTVLWGQAAVPSAHLPEWAGASVEARLDPAAERARLNANASGAWRLGKYLLAGVQDSYSLTQNGVAGVTVLESWETTKSVRLTIPAVGTSLTAQTHTRAGRDDWAHGIGGEQVIFGGFSISTMASDLRSDNPSMRFTARFRRQW